MIDLSKPLENWADKESENLHVWAETAWSGFVKTILQILEANEISNLKFAQVVSMLARAFMDGEDGYVKLAEAATYTSTEVTAWAQARKLPRPLVRDRILRELLAATAREIRGKDYQDYVASVMRLTGLTDHRQTNSYRVLTPSSRGRSVHRIGLPRRVSNLLCKQGVKTLHDLGELVRPPLHVERQRPFSLSDERLHKMPGLGLKHIMSILDTVRSWDNSFSTPASLHF